MQEHPLVVAIRSERIARGLSYAALAEVSGYSPQAIWWLEHRSKQPREQTMRDLAQALGLTLQEAHND